MQKKITSKSFAYVEKDTQELYAIKIKEGRFKGVIYTYGKVQLKEDKDNDELGLEFQFFVNRGCNRYTLDDLKESRKFKDYISKILKYILEEEFADNDKHTETDTKEDL